MTVAAITTEIQKLEPSAVIELFELDATEFGGDLLRFHAGTNGVSSNVVWQGNTYTAYPIKATGFDFTGNGQLPRPKMIVSNITGVITLLVLTYDDLLGAKVTRRRTMVKYLDAVNFGGTNPTADPTAEFPNDVFFVDRKVSETSDVVEFELASAFDVAGVLVPHRQIIQNVCVWRYKGTECGYSGTRYFDANDQPVASSGLDVCGKRLSSCEARFKRFITVGDIGTGYYVIDPLPFGSFPSAGLVR
jgi:lambda family phage minor tail protein L